MFKYRVSVSCSRKWPVLQGLVYSRGKAQKSVHFISSTKFHCTSPQAMVCNLYYTSLLSPGQCILPGSVLCHPDIPNNLSVASISYFSQVQKSISMLVTSVPWEDVSISGSLWDDLVSHLRFALQSRCHSELY